MHILYVFKITYVEASFTNPVLYIYDLHLITIENYQSNLC